jgi:hypothetical protein
MSNDERITTSPAFYDGLPYETIIERLTGVDISLFIGEMLEPLGLDRRAVLDLEDKVLESHFASTRAAFAAGIAVGLDPKQVLLTKLDGGAQ